MTRLYRRARRGCESRRELVGWDVISPPAPRRTGPRTRYDPATSPSPSRRGSACSLRPRHAAPFEMTIDSFRASMRASLSTPGKLTFITWLCIRRHIAVDRHDRPEAKHDAHSDSYRLALPFRRVRAPPILRHAESDDERDRRCTRPQAHFLPTPVHDRGERRPASLLCLTKCPDAFRTRGFCGR